MNTEFKDIDKRYDLFWLGMKYEKENNFQQAIETYLLYSEALAFADRYIPHIWVSVLYDKLNLPSKAIYHIEQHVKGYIEWKASIHNKDLSKSKIGELYKDIGKRYLVINELENATLNHRNSDGGSDTSTQICNSSIELHSTCKAIHTRLACLRKDKHCLWHCNQR